jgi:hypothetical protein
MHLGSASSSCSSVCDVLDNRHWDPGPETLLMAVQDLFADREGVGGARGWFGSREN